MLRLKIGSNSNSEGLQKLDVVIGRDGRDEPKAIFVPNIPNPAKMTIDEIVTAFIVSDLLVTNCIVRLSLFVWYSNMQSSSLIVGY